MDYDDDFNSDHELEQQQHRNHHLLDDDDENDDVWNRRERSPPTPVHDEYKSKPRKRLIKKSSAESEPVPDFRLRDEEEGDYGVGEEDDLAGLVRDESEDGGGPSSSSGGGGGGKRKTLGKESGGGAGERRKKEKRREGKVEKKFNKTRKVGHSGVGRSRDHEGDREMKEMWDTIAGGDSEVCS